MKNLGPRPALWSGFVFAHLPGERAAVPAGRLEMAESGTDVLGSRFGYGSHYLRRGNAIDVDPRSLPLAGAESGSARQERPVNDLTMFGAIRDAAPDAWGRRVIEAKLKVPPNSLPESVYLMQSGTERFGALDFASTLNGPSSDSALPPAADVRYLVEAADRLQRGEPLSQSMGALFHAASLGGARPKANVIDEGRLFLAKFPAAHDAFDVPLIEHACLELAREAGLRVPALKRLQLADGRNVLMIERFDRISRPDGSRERKHAVSALTMLGLHESESKDASYAAIAGNISTTAASQGVKDDRRELFGRMIFNVLVSNDDDHLRNHAFVREREGWRLSPLYDVVPKPQISFERHLHLSVGPQGRAASLENALAGHRDFAISRDEALHIIDRVGSVVREWRSHFERLGVPTAQCDRVQSAFRRPSELDFDRLSRTPSRTPHP